jgi:aryl-alcohol dehydrogenase-like predicted oxidoreductase
MRYTLLGNTGLRVSSLAFGTMTFGDGSGFSADEATSRAMFDLYLDHGGNFVDSANVYGDGKSEQHIGAFMKGKRDRVALATKYTVVTDPSDPNSAGNGRKNLVQSLEKSLRRLDTDYIDLFWLHGWDGITPVDEPIRALDDLMRAGKILHIGYSNHPAWQVSRIDMLAQERGYTRPAAIQVEYNLAQRTPDRDLIPMAEQIGLSVVAWAPLAGGALTGKYLGDGKAGGRIADAKGFYGKYRGDNGVDRIAQVTVDAAHELGCSPNQLAVAWLLHRSPKLIPLLGARRPDQLADTLDALNIVIPGDILNKLEEASAVDLGFPHDFLRDERRHWFSDLDDDLDPTVLIGVTGVR